MTLRARTTIAVVTGALLSLTACGGGSSAGQSETGDAATDGGSVINIVGFAVPEAANKAIA